MVSQVLRYQLLIRLPRDKAEGLLNNVKPTLDAILTIAPVLQIFQYVIFGSIFGAIQGFLNIKLRLGEVLSAIASGMIYILTLCVVPLITVKPLLQEIFGLGSSDEFLIYMLTLVHGILFTASLTLTSIRQGPFSKFWEGKPKHT